MPECSSQSILALHLHCICMYCFLLSPLPGIQALQEPSSFLFEPVLSIGTLVTLTAAPMQSQVSDRGTTAIKAAAHV